MSFYEQNQLQFQVPTLTQPMEVGEPQQQVSSFTTTQMAYGAASIPGPQDHGSTLLAPVHVVSVNDDRENPSSYERLQSNYAFNGFPPGIRFQPTDSELILYYLLPKIQKQEIPSVPIRDVNLYEHSPDKIAEIYLELNEGEGYFFTPRDRKYPNGDRPNRGTGCGYWKATGSDKHIEHDGKTIGMKKTLVYYEGEAKSRKGVKTSWIMHEYCVKQKKSVKRSEIDMRLDDFVLCRIYKKGNKSLRSRQPVEVQGRSSSELGDASGNGRPQNQENVDSFHDFDHSSGFGNAYANNSQDSQLESCSVKDEVALAGFDSSGFGNAYANSSQDSRLECCGVEDEIALAGFDNFTSQYNDDFYSMVNIGNPYSTGFFM